MGMEGGWRGNRGGGWLVVGTSMGWKGKGGFSGREERGLMVRVGKGKIRDGL